MVWKCQNEISPIFYYGISEKTNEKDLKISNIQPPDWKNPYWMSLYVYSSKWPQWNKYSGAWNQVEQFDGVLDIW